MCIYIYIYITCSTSTKSTFITQYVNKVLVQIFTLITFNEHIIKPHYTQHTKASLLRSVK